MLPEAQFDLYEFFQTANYETKRPKFFIFFGCESVANSDLLR